MYYLIPHYLLTVLYYTVAMTSVCLMYLSILAPRRATAAVEMLSPRSRRSSRLLYSRQANLWGWRSESVFDSGSCTYFRLRFSLRVELRLCHLQATAVRYLQCMVCRGRAGPLNIQVLGVLIATVTGTVQHIPTLLTSVTGVTVTYY
ncbi:hypothetical protein F4859DRAFT_474586 [Xylaria cf. heliscus]|nr:hypothetical protein F4859DRAFT_474586 [Xylaria cf. heliscus]